MFELEIEKRDKIEIEREPKILELAQPNRTLRPTAASGRPSPALRFHRASAHNRARPICLPPGPACQPRFPSPLSLTERPHTSAAPLPFPFSLQRNAAAEITGEFAGIFIPLRPAEIPGPPLYLALATLFFPSPHHSAAPRTLAAAPLTPAVPRLDPPAALPHPFLACAHPGLRTAPR